MIITITLDDLDIAPTISNNDIVKLFISKISMYLKRYDVEEIITNSKIGTVLQDDNRFIYEPLNNVLSIAHKPDPYLIGNLYNIKVKVDPNMRWDDDRIIPKGSELRLRKEKILKILGKKEFEDFIEEIIVDKKLSNMLF